MATQARATPPIGPRAVLVVAALLLGGLAALLVTRALDGGEGTEDLVGDAGAGAGLALEALDRAGSVPLAAGSPAVAIDPSTVPVRYQVVYRSTTFAGGEPAESTEIVSVERPFSSRIELRSGRPPGTGDIGSRVSAFGRFAVRTGTSEWESVVVPPALAASDIRADVAVPEAVARGELERREARAVHGRWCQVYRAGGPVASGTLVPVGGGEAGEYADVCIDASGLVLEELWVREGEVLRRRVAEVVRSGLAFPAGTFEGGAAGEPVRFEDGGGSTRPVDPDSRPGGVTWELPDPAAGPLRGFTLAGRFAVVPPRLEAQVDPGNPNRRRTAGIVDVWVRGIDVVFVDQGGTTQGQRAFGAHPHGRAVELGRLDLGEAFLDFRSNEVRTAFTDGYFVRVYGTLRLDDLVRIARSLEPAEGGELRYLDVAE